MNRAILLFKPDAFDLRAEYNGVHRNVAEIGRFMLAGRGLIIIQERKPLLTPQDVYKIYERVLRPNPADDAVWGVQWKQDVISHLTSRPVEALLVEDALNDEPMLKAREIRDSLRARYSRPNDVIRNIVHVPDDGEFSFTHGILFDNPRGEHE